MGKRGLLCGSFGVMAQELDNIRLVYGIGWLDWELLYTQVSHAIHLKRITSAKKGTGP